MDDLISRKAALDAIGEEPTVWNVDDDITIGERAQWRADVLAIKTLPAAEPERMKGEKVRFIKEENVNGFIEQVITALQDINYALWEIDIPSPTVPEYIEHHQQVQGVMKLVEEKLEAIREDAKRMEDDLK